MSDYVSNIAQLLGLTACTGKGPFGQKSGAAIGSRSGYLVAVGPAKIGNASAISIVVRYANAAQPYLVRSAIESNQEVLKALNASKFPSARKKQLTVTNDGVRLNWVYHFGKPSGEKIAAFVIALLGSLKGVAPSFETKCEMCHANCSQIVLYNGTPGYYCLSCQSTARQQQDAAAQQYEEKETNLMMGVVYGVVAALAGSIAWGLVAYGLNRIFLWGAVLIGILIAKAVFAGMGKINRAGQVLVFVLTVASVLFGDAIFYTLSVMRSENMPFTWELLKNIVLNLQKIEAEGNGLFTVAFSLFGAGYVVYTKARKPKFEAVFEPVDTTGTIADGTTAGR